MMPELRGKSDVQSRGVFKECMGLQVYFAVPENAGRVCREVFLCVKAL